MHIGNGRNEPPHSSVWSSNSSSDDDLRPPPALPLHLSTTKAAQRVRFYHQQPQHSLAHDCRASWSASSSSSPMQMSAYESMLASQQWTQQRVRQASAAQDAAQQIPTHRVVSTLGLVVLTYFVCCGGPVGTEPLVSSGGPLRGLVAQVAFPLLVNTPIMLAVVELATAYANDGGYTVWVMHAFGAFSGFQVGFWSWVATLLDRVVYIQFLFAHLAAPLGYAYNDPSRNGNSVYRFSFAGAYAVKATAAVLLSIPTLFCTKSLVRALCIHLVLVLVPLAVLTVWGFAKTESLSVFRETEPDAATITEAFNGAWSVDWRTYVSVFWYYDGFYLAAVFGGEVAKPHRTYPRGFQWSFVLTWLSYLLPMLAVVGAAGTQRLGLHWSFFEEDAYPDIARTLGGTTLYVISLVGLVAGVTGMYIAKLFCQAYQMLGMAEHGLLPSLFARNPRQSIYFSTAMVLALLAIDDLGAVQSVRDALSGLVELAIIVAAFRLRQTQPFVTRPFKIPGGWCGMGALLLLPTLMLSYQVGLQFWEREPAVVLCSTLTTGVVLSVVQLGYRNWQQRKAALATMRMAPTSTTDAFHESRFAR